MHDARQDVPPSLATPAARRALLLHAFADWGAKPHPQQEDSVVLPEKQLHDGRVRPELFVTVDDAFRLSLTTSDGLSMGAEAGALKIIADIDAEAAEVIRQAIRQEAAPGPNDGAADDALAGIRAWLDARGEFRRVDDWDIWTIPVIFPGGPMLVWLRTEGDTRHTLRVTNGGNHDQPAFRQRLLRSMAEAGVDVGLFGTDPQEAVAEDVDVDADAARGNGGSSSESDDQGEDRTDSTQDSEGDDAAGDGAEFVERGRYGRGTGNDLPPLPTLEEALARTTVEAVVALAKGGEEKARQLRKPSVHFYDLVRFALDDQARLDAIRQATTRKAWSPRGLWKEVEAEVRRYASAARSATSDGAKSPFRVTEAGEVRKDSSLNVQIALSRLGIVLRFNAFAHEVRIDGLPGVVEREGGRLAMAGVEDDVLLDDASERRLHLLMDMEFNFAPWRAAFDAAIDVLARQRSFHPVLDRITATKWDNVARIDSWLVDYLGAENMPLNRAIGRIILVAMVRRLRHPGVKFDHLPTLVGRGALLKSTSLMALAFDDPALFTDDVTLGMPSREFIERTDGFWIVEFAELAGIRKNDIEHIKALLSRRQDVARLAYDRHRSRRPRSHFAWGTSNQKDFLLAGDPERRFWPIKLSGPEPIDIPRLRIAVPQLLAEAALAEATGEPIFLNREQSEQMADVIADHQQIDPWEEMLAQALTAQDGRQPAGWMTISNIQAALGIPAERRHPASASRISGILERLGFAKSGRERLGGRDGQARLWVRYNSGSQPPLPGIPLSQVLPRLKLQPPAEDGDGEIKLTIVHPSRPGKPGNVTPLRGRPGAATGSAPESAHAAEPPEVPDDPDPKDDDDYGREDDDDYGC